MSRRKEGLREGVMVLRYSISEAVNSFAALEWMIPAITKSTPKIF
jgi:hypothetical protein